MTDLKQKLIGELATIKTTVLANAALDAAEKTRVDAENVKIDAENKKLEAAAKTSKEQYMISASSRRYKVKFKPVEPISFERLMTYVFATLYQFGKNHDGIINAKKFNNNVAPKFGLPLAGPDAYYVASPQMFDEFRDRTWVRLLDVDYDGATDNVLLTVNQIIKNRVEVMEPVTEWVKVDADTKKKQPKLDETGAPVMKVKSQTDTMVDARLTYLFPMSFFTDLLEEIGRDSLIDDAPKGYVPGPLGQLSSVLNIGGRGFNDVQLIEMIRDYGDDGFGRRGLHHGGPWEKKMLSYHMHPAYAKPFRVFLKPEVGSDRLEVQIEYYPDEEIKAHHALIQNRTDWLKFDVRHTATLKKLYDEVYPPEPPTKLTAEIVGKNFVVEAVREE